MNVLIDKENSIARASVVNVRVNSYTIYDSKKGINVVVKLYVPTRNSAQIYGDDGNRYG